jgi:Zn-dependent peptidase ImmA (M78 family)/DNA-binding XRE family transcriptional regulator
MRPGTPGFVGSRLREAREARGLTGVTLSDLVDLTPQMISKYEHGESTPGPDVLQSMASALNMPVAFFTMPQRGEVSSAPIFFRSMAATSKGARKRACWKIEWLRDITTYLGQGVTFPKVNLPDLGLPDDPTHISSEEIEHAAAVARSYWNMSDTAPISNMVRLLENQGVFVARQQLGADTLDGLSMIDPSNHRPYVLIGEDKGTAVRWRFDAAHELGHLLMHRTRRESDLGDTARFKLIETQAHRFAAAFLLPMDPFLEDLYAISLDVMASMKPRWKVSIAMMILRARHAGLLTELTEKRLWMNYRRRWGRQEPYDAEIEAETPTLIKRAAELLLTEAHGADDLLAHVALPPRDIEGLIGLDAGYLDRDFVPVSLRTDRFSGSTKGEDRGRPARVIDFPTRRVD